MNIEKILDSQLKGVIDILKDSIKIGDFYYESGKSDTGVKMYKVLNSKLNESVFEISEVGEVKVNGIVLCDLDEYNQNLVFAVEDLLNSEDLISHINYLLNYCVINEDSQSYYEVDKEDDYISSDFKFTDNKVVQNCFNEFGAKSENVSTKKSNLDTDSITDVKIVALKYNGKLVAYRFKTNIGCFDIDKETAQSYGVSEYKVTKAITLNKCNNLLMSNSEISGKRIIPDISSNFELCNKLFNLLFN